MSYDRVGLDAAMAWQLHRITAQLAKSYIPRPSQFHLQANARAVPEPFDYMAVTKTKRRPRIGGNYHGSLHGYTNYKCRCEACREVNRVYGQEQRALRRVLGLCQLCDRPCDGYARCAIHRQRNAENSRLYYTKKVKPQPSIVSEASHV